MLASFCGHAEVVKTIFETTKAKELLFDVDSEGWTSLFYATAMGHDQVVERKVWSHLFSTSSSHSI
jgi:ankyrin repeat protein